MAQVDGIRSTGWVSLQPVPDIFTQGFKPTKNDYKDFIRNFYMASTEDRKDYYAVENFEISFNDIDEKLEKALAQQYGGDAKDYSPPAKVGYIAADSGGTPVVVAQLDAYSQWLADGKKKD